MSFIVECSENIFEIIGLIKLPILMEQSRGHHQAVKYENHGKVEIVDVLTVVFSDFPNTYFVIMTRFSGL